MSRYRVIFKRLSIVLALLIALGPVLQRTSLPARAAGLASSTSAPQEASTGAQAAASTAQATDDFDWQNERVKAGLQTAFDALAHQAINAAGLDITSMQSQLDSASLGATGNHVTGQGTWTVKAQDAQHVERDLSGMLGFVLDAQYSGNAAVTATSASVLEASSELSGTLKSADTELVLSASVTSSRDDTTSGIITQGGHLQTALTTGGKTSNVSVDSSGQTRTLAYNLTSSETNTKTNRDGTIANATQVVTIRTVSRTESEVWVHTTGGTTDALDQHYFQRIDGGSVEQYLDRFDLNTGGIAYSLKTPTQISATIDGDATYKFVLTDPSGKELNYNSTMKPQSLAPGRMLGLYSPEDSSTTFTLAGSKAAILASTLQGPCGSAGAFGIGAAAGIAIAAILALAFLEFAPILLLGGAVYASEFAFLEGAMMFGIGALGGVGAGCNGDPYFVDEGLATLPAVVSNTSATLSATSGHIQITRSTGGIISPSTAITATTAVTTSAASNIASQDYRENPEPFVGGKLPEGASAIGTWKWDSDPAHAYASMPSHTQDLSKGAQMHYFIHASTPLTLTADDNIVQYVYLDPHNPPVELYMQFYTGNGDGEHRVYWGEDKVQTGGIRGRSSLYPMGALPSVGGWVRLQVPVAKLGLENKPINGILYGAYAGQTWWGPTTNSNRLTDNAPDALPVSTEPVQPAFLPGAQIGYTLSQKTTLSIDIKDASGVNVRSLVRNQLEEPGYIVAVWDGKDDQGVLLDDAPYVARITTGGETEEAPVTISPFVANLISPSPYSVLRGQDVPVLGEAFGQKFQQYSLLYGQGANPTSWITITDSLTPSALPSVNNTLNHAGNLANWSVGIDEFKPWQDAGLNGLYTLRLVVTGSDGREATDSLPVLVGNLAYTAEGGEIASADGGAKIDIPAFGTFSSFSLIALAPVTDTVTGDWRASLPVGVAPAGGVYEAFPPDEVFRRPATLTMSYDKSLPVDKVALMIGDGTQAGWRYLGGNADAQTGLISVDIDGLTGLGKRAFIAPFVAGSAGFSGDLVRATSMALSFGDSVPAPLVSPDGSSTGFYSDLETGAGQWEALDRFGTQLSRVTGADAGLSDGDSALKVTRTAGGTRLVNALSTPIDATKYPVLEFDYNMPSGYSPNILVKSNGTWWQMHSGNDGFASRTVAGRYFETITAPELVADGSWHHYQLDVLGLLRENDPSATSFQVDDIAFGQINELAYMQYVPVDNGEVGDSYYLDNFAMLKPTNLTGYNLTFAAPQEVTYSAYSYVVDQKVDTVPAETATGTTASQKVDLPGSALDGLWYVHVRGQDASGTWGATTHFPILVDRQGPTVGRSDPPPDGAGSPDTVVIPILDSNGVDSTSIQVQYGTNSYTLTPGKAGLQYAPELQLLDIVYNALDPRPVAVTNGQKIAVAVNSVQDYAGNQLKAPVSWSFTADKPVVANQPDFHQVTVNGGEQPALSPDGTMLAFVSNRSGTSNVWVMSATDYEEKANSAHQLLGSNDTAHESDPAWSPDGAKLAYVSDRDGTQQLWVAGVDGSGATALTTGDGGAASPTWMPDSKSIVFVRDGNLWQIIPDGTGLRSLTNDPDRPMRTVRVQPNGNLLAVGYKLYQETIKLYNPTTDQFTDLTEGGTESEPTWLDSDNVLYTSPQTGTQSSVLQLGVTGSTAAVLQGSGVPGTADLEATAANPNAGGQEIALVSTRGGDRNVWLRQDLEISRLQVEPSVGVPAGDPMTVKYTLPTTATVTIQVLDNAGTLVRTLVDNAVQPGGAQEVVWDSKTDKDVAVAAGDYVVTLSAKVPSGDTLTRLADARVLAAASFGTLSLEIDQWSGKPLTTQLYSLQSVVYAQGDTSRPVARGGYYDYQPSFKLPEGIYDVQVEYGGTRTYLRNVSVQGSQTTSQTVNLQQGELDVSVLSSPGQPATGSPYIKVSRSGDTTKTLVQSGYEPVSNFILAPGKYDVLVEYQGVTKQVFGIQVKAGQATAQDVDLGSGVITLTVHETDATLAEDNTGRLTVNAYVPGDHDHYVAYSFNNPAQLRVPAGTYDLKVSYGTVAKGFEPASLSGGSITEWIYGVQVGEGQTVTQDYNMKLSPVALAIEEAKGKSLVVPSADQSKVSFTVFQEGVYTSYVGLSYISTLHMQLPAGTYRVVADYTGTNLRQLGLLPDKIVVTEGQSVDQTIDLALGHVNLTVHDAAGQMIDPQNVYVIAYPAGTTDNAFSTSYRTNPVDLPVHSGVAYDLEVHLYTGQVTTLKNKQVAEGETVNLDLSTADMK